MNNEIATSQVFRITNSRQEEYALVFTDGSRQSITREQLSRYGSQVDANLRGEPIFNGRALDYIQVNTPMEFLPEGVSLVDTPGLGALYKSHESITQNYVRNAAAVIFVFDPERPMVVQEQAFIEKVLEVTPYILFVMTKIDLHGQAVWSDLIRRNEELLRPLFESKNEPFPQIFPISSLGLKKAAKETDQNYREMELVDSLFPAVKEELQRMMYQTVGLLRTGFALSEAEKQTIRVRSTIEDLIRSTVADTKEEQDRIRQEKEQLQRSLQSEWGPTSNKRAEVQQQINDICKSVSSRVQQLFLSTGHIYRSYSTMIDEITTMGEVQQMADTLAENVVNDVASQWQSISSQAVGNVKTVLYSLNAQMEATSYGKSSLNGVRFNEIALVSPKFSNDIVSKGLQYLILFNIPIIGPVLAVGKAIWDWLTGKERQENETVMQNKNVLRKALGDMLQEMNRQLLHVVTGNRSVVEDFITTLSSSARDSINNIFEEQKQQLQQAARNLDEQARKGAEEKKQELVRLNAQRETWSGIANQVTGAAKLHKEIQQVFTPNTSTTC